jgi:hypothetical protein
MRRLLASCLVAVPALIACSNQDPAPMFVEVSYQVRCINCSPRAADDSPHAVTALDGENGFHVSCDIEQPAKDRLISFSVQNGNYAIKILQAALDKPSPGTNCSVVVIEGSNTYRGACTDGSPTADEPCQVKLGVSHGNVTGTLLCENIPNDSDATVMRHVVKPGTDQPTAIEVDGCSGL